MADSNIVIHESCSIDDFKLWKIPELRAFCKRRGLPSSSKRKYELVALAYAAAVQKLPCVMSVDDEVVTAKAEYESLLMVDGIRLPDPKRITNGWIGEANGIKMWPPTFHTDISLYLLERDEKCLLKRLQNDYKEVKAYSYFKSTNSWLKEVFFHEINEDSHLCFLKTECSPSQRVVPGTIPHVLWVCIEKKSGVIRAAHCTCMAGLSSTCNHVAALLFKIDYACQHGLTRGNVRACTSEPNVWKTPSLRTVEPMKCKDMIFEKPKYGRIPKSKVRSNKSLFGTSHSKKGEASPELEELLSALYQSCDSAAAWQYTYPEVEQPDEAHCDTNVSCFVEVETLMSVPEPLCDFSKKFSTGEELIANLPTYSEDEINRIEETTRDQSESTAWKKQRCGRITASISHSVLTRYRSGNTNNTNSLLNQILGNKDVNPDIASLKYGRLNEPEAVQVYINHQKNKHKNLKVAKCGLYVLSDKVYIGASPDRIVSCDCCGTGCLEVKCPISQAGKTVDNLHATYVKECKLNINHMYHTQIQHQMGVTGYMWCDFVVYLKSDIMIERVAFDKDIWNEIEEACTHYFKNNVANALVS